MPNNQKELIDPKTIEWVWILTQAITKHRDSMLTLEDQKENVEFIPCFNNREDAQILKPRLCKEEADKYTENAIHITELAKIAARRNFEILLLDKEGKILTHLATEVTLANESLQEEC